MTTQVQVTGGELPQEEIQAYIEHGKKSYPGREDPADGDHGGRGICEHQLLSGGPAL